MRIFLPQENAGKSEGKEWMSKLIFLKANEWRILSYKGEFYDIPELKLCPAPQNQSNINWRHSKLA
jgi:hypothetical protein